MGDLLWLDLETTALDPREGEILEVAIMWRDATWEWTIRPTHPLHLEKLDPVLVEMHRTSGLFEEAEHGGSSLVSVEQDILGHIGDHPRAREDRLMLAGFSVHFDLSWLRVHMPWLARHLSHRVYDVSTVKTLCTSLGWVAPDGPKAHRAAADVAEARLHDRLCREFLATKREERTP